MTDQKRGPPPSVPSVSQTRSDEGLRSEPALSPFKIGALAGAVLVTIGGVIGLIWGFDPYSNQFQAVASLNSSRVRIDEVSCVSVNPKDLMFARKAYSDPDLAEAIAETLSIKNILLSEDGRACRWGFGTIIVPGIDTAVRFNGQFSRYLVSVDICEKLANGGLDSNRCLSKNVYVFNSSVAPRDLFRIGLTGLARPQATEWEAFQRKKSE